MAYIRGFYWNSRMNHLLYPDWRTHLEIDLPLYREFQQLFDWLVENNNLSIHINNTEKIPLCEGMLWRMKPIWTIDVSHVLCRDADAITTYKEAQYTQHWLEIGKVINCIHDNPSHSGLMGGMIGIETAGFKALTGLNSWAELISGYNLEDRGSDQHLLNRKILPEVSQNIIYYDKGSYPNPPHQPIEMVPQVDAKLWESNLVCRHIGSAGVVDMEILRFFKRFDAYNWKFQVIEVLYPKLFYWHL